jgi:cbb3-type cytochrome oxidase subunit 3
MLQELAARTGVTGWAIASTLFFLGIYVVITVRVFRARSEDMNARARLALDDDEGCGARRTAEAGTQD